MKDTLNKFRKPKGPACEKGREHSEHRSETGEGHVSFIYACLVYLTQHMLHNEILVTR